MWLGHIKGARKWTQQESIAISKSLSKYNDTRPSDIHRNIRTLDHIKYWKASEFRTFLLYIGVVVLKNRLSQREYTMFLKLFCAVTICSSNVYVPYLTVARKLFAEFIENHIELYGEASITMNIHNLSHVVDEVETFGSLDTISAYKFENHLHHLKLKLKQCNKPLQQIARRITESSYLEKNALSKHNQNFPYLKHPVSLYDGTTVFRWIHYNENAVLSSFKENEKDKWFLTFNNEIIEFDCVLKDNVNKKHMIRGSALKNVQNFFETVPFNSKYLNLFLSDREKAEPQYYPLNSIKSKMFCLSYNSEWVFIPLLHTLKRNDHAL